MILWKKSLIGLCIMAALAACNGQPTPPANPQPAAASLPTAQAASQTAPQETYIVRIANEPYPPFNIFNSDNTFSGLEIDVLNAIAKNQNFKIQFTPYVWDVIFKNMEKEQVHMVIGGLNEDDMDKNAVVVSKSYMKSGDCVVARDEATLQDWQNKKTILVETDDLKDSLINKYGAKNTNLHEVAKSQFESLKLINAKQYDTSVSDCTVLKYYTASSFKDHKFAIQELPLPENDHSFDLVFGIRKDQTELLNKINTGIENIKQSGELDAILKKWQ